MSDQMDAAAIKRTLDCGRSGCGCSGTQKTHCPGPSHTNGDRNPSLGITEKDGKVLVKCYGGCDQATIVTALQERDLWPRKEDRAPTRAKGGEPLRIVATYEYRDSTGGLAFQVVRLDPKDFRQRRPNTRGGWDWKAGDRSIVYRLPELLATDPSELIFLCEGEKDADALVSLGLVATTAAGGAGKWSDGNSRWFDGRRVVILPDNDVAGQEDAARKLASLRMVAAQVAILSLDGLPPKGDVSDWLAAGGTADRLLALAGAALAQVPDSSSETRIPAPALAQFPTDILPPSMRALIESGAQSMLVPAEFIAVPSLVLAGTVIGNAWEIELKGGWREGPNLYAAIVGDPGAKKTPSMKLALRAIHEIQDRLYQDYRAQKAAHEEEKALWERTPKKERGAPPEPPKFPHIWTSDSTTEALAEMLSESQGLVLFRDELVGWVKSMDAYRSGGKGADRQHYLSMWSRSPIKIDRKSRPDPIMVQRPCLSVVGGIQPDVLPDLIENTARDDGFIDRLLFSYPDINADHWTDDGVDEAAQAAAQRLFSALYDLKGAEMPSGDVVPRVARFGQEARALWREWYDANGAEYRDEKLASSLKGTWAKLPSQLARLTLILHVAWAVDAGQAVSAIIPEATLAAACDLIDYFKEHARAALGELRTPRPQLEDRIIAGLRERGPSTSRTIRRDVLNESIKADRVKSTLERLLEDGRVSVSDVPVSAKGGRPTRLWSAVETEEPKRETGRSRPGFHARDAG